MTLPVRIMAQLLLCHADLLRMNALLAVTQPSCTPLQKHLCSGTLRFALQAYLAWPVFLYAPCCVFTRHNRPNEFGRCSSFIRTVGFASAARMLLHAFGILLPGVLLYNFTGLMG